MLISAILITISFNSIFLSLIMLASCLYSFPVMPNSCSAPKCTTGYYESSGVAVFRIPSEPQDIVHKWKRFLHRDGKYFLYLLD